MNNIKIKLCLILWCFSFCYLNANFYENTLDIQNVLNTFDIDTNYQVDAALFEQHHEKTMGYDWEHFIDSYEKGYYYIPILKQMLSDADVPQEFLYLAMAESRFSTRAYSSKKAVGIWQIMKPTAKSLGLRIDNFIDERKDPIKSTQAAIKYLKQLKSITGKWYLAAMAYNCGIGRLQRAIKEAGTDDINVLMDDKKGYIPLETINYIRLILSMNLAFSNVDVLKNLDKEYFLNRGSTITLASVKVPAGTDFNSIAAGAGMSVKELRKYNMQFKYNFTPPNGKEYDVYIPYEHLLAFKTKFKPRKANFSKFYIVYKVKRGDNLYTIAKRYNVSVDKIKSTNNIKKTMLSINQKIIIPLIQTNQKLAYKGK